LALPLEAALNTLLGPLLRRPWIFNGGLESIDLLL
jgi:hypothetical protein